MYYECTCHIIVEVDRGEYFTEFQKIAFWKSFLVVIPLGTVSPSSCPLMKSRIWETLLDWEMLPSFETLPKWEILPTCETLHNWEMFPSWEILPNCETLPN